MKLIDSNTRFIFVTAMAIMGNTTGSPAVRTDVELNGLNNIACTQWNVDFARCACLVARAAGVQQSVSQGCISIICDVLLSAYTATTFSFFMQKVFDVVFPRYAGKSAGGTCNTKWCCA